MAHRWQAHPQRDRSQRLPARRLGAMVLVVLLAAVSAPSLSAMVGPDGGHRPDATAAPADITNLSLAESEAAPVPSGTAIPVLRGSAIPISALADLLALAALPQATDAAAAFGSALPSKKPPSSAVAPSRHAVGRGSKVVFLGDSYTSGWNGAGIGARGWPRLVASARGWRSLNLAVPGTGYVDPGWTGQPIGSLVGRAIDDHPKVVVVAAGHNDFNWPRSATAAAADKVIMRIHRALPHALLVVIAPMWQNGRPPASLVALRDHLRRVAATVGALFIDPIAERWFAGSRQALISADGIHPSDRGHRYIAARVLADLARGGV